MAGATQGSNIPNINQLAAGAVRGAGTGAMYEMTQPTRQLATTDLSQYQNPYTQQVIDTSMADLERQRQMQMNQMGAQATAAGAFGGSRHGVAEALTNEAFARQGGQLASGLRQQGYGQALQAAQQDIQNALAAGQSRLAAGGQLANIANLGFGMGRTVQQDLAQQGLQQQAMMQRLIDAAKGQYAGYTGMPAQSLTYVPGAAGTGSVGGTTTATGPGNEPGLFDYLTLGAAGLNTAKNLGMIGAGIGAGALGGSLIGSSALMGATAPATLAGITGSAGIAATTPAFASLAAASDRRLKDNIEKIGEYGPLNVYKWVYKWGEKSVGFMADEVKKVLPEAVITGADGYDRVYYDKVLEAF